MSARRLRCVSNWALVASLVWCLPAAQPSAQAPSLDDVLERSASYVDEFRKQLSGIVAEEIYHQEIVNTGRIPSWPGTRVRKLRSELLLVRPSDSDRYVELRDVFEVDGEPIRDRESRLEQLLRLPSAANTSRIGAILEESARYNIGRITRTINTPLMTLQFLDAATQKRFRFRHVPKPTAVFTGDSGKAANDAPVFRVATEVWTVEYQERERPTIIRQLDGRNQPAHGRFWINPSDGSILISELIVDSAGVIATITVSYQSEPLMGFLVPVEMRESYLRNPERITGVATYGKFRQIK